MGIEYLTCEGYGFIECVRPVIVNKCCTTCPLCCIRSAAILHRVFVLHILLLPTSGSDTRWSDRLHPEARTPRGSSIRHGIICHFDRGRSDGTREWAEIIPIPHRLETPSPRKRTRKKDLKTKKKNKNQKKKKRWKKRKR